MRRSILLALVALAVAVPAISFAGFGGYGGAYGVDYGGGDWGGHGTLPLYTTLSADDTSISAGQQVTLSWTVIPNWAPLLVVGLSPDVTEQVIRDTYPFVDNCSSNFGIDFKHEPPDGGGDLNIAATTSGTSIVAPTVTTQYWVSCYAAPGAFNTNTSTTTHTSRVTITVASAIDLTASVLQTTATTNVAKSLAATITNSGSLATGGTDFNVRFQIADDSAGTNAVSIGNYVVTANVLPSTNVTATKSYTFTAAGNKYYRACADTPAPVITESDEANNCAAWKKVTIADAAKPDLNATVPTGLTVSGGVPTTFSATVTNDGSASTGVGFNMIWQVASSSSGTGLVNVNNSSGGLDGTPTATLGITSRTLTSNDTYTFPTSFTGTRYYRACADLPPLWYGTISESDEGDNCGGWAAIVVVNPSDLTADGVTWSGSVSAGTAKTFSAVIRNQGTGATTNSFVNLFQVADDAAGTNAANISPNPALTSLAAGANSQVSVPYTFPSSAAGTTKYMRACADLPPLWVGTNLESNDGNNCGVWTAISLNPPVPPTLTCGVDNAAPVPGGTATYTIDPQPADSPYTWTPAGGAVCVTNCASNTALTRTYRFPTEGQRYDMTVAGNGGSPSDVCTSVTPVSLCTSNLLTITANGDNPARVNAGTKPTIAWSADASCTCSVSGPGLSASGNSGSQQTTSNVTTQSVYTLSCSGHTKDLIVNVVPRFEEF